MEKKMETKKSNLNKYIAVAYRLYAVDEAGEVLVEEAVAEQPFCFISGYGVALDAFERQIAPLAKDDTFDFTLSEGEAYGPYMEEHVVDLERGMFCVNGHFDHDHVFEGAIIPLQNEDGHRFNGKVIEIGDESVKIDLNHPLAGEVLRFEGSVVEAREATASEIEGLINRMTGGCGCGCGCHGQDEHECGCHGHDDDEGGWQGDDEHECGCHGHEDHKHGDGHCGCGHCH